MGTQLVLSFAKRLFFNLCNTLNPKPNSQTIRIFSPYRNISLFSLVFILTLRFGLIEYVFHISLRFYVILIMSIFIGQSFLSSQWRISYSSNISRKPSMMTEK